MSEGDLVLVQREGHVATFTLNRPAKLNALNAALLGALRDTIVAASNAASAGNAIRAAILTGAGEKAFAAGADVAELAEFSVDQALQLAQIGHAACEALEGAPFPIIAAVNGFALGGGCEMVLACDFALASERAKLGQPEVNLGILPGFGGTQRLARRVGVARARELIYTARTVSADEAKRMGLVNEVYPHDDLLPAARAMAELIATKGPLAISAAKRVLRRGIDAPLAVGCELEANAFASLFGSDDQRAECSAFLRKQMPEFHGKLLPRERACNSA